MRAVLMGLLLLAAPAASADPFAPSKITLPSQETFAGRFAAAQARAKATLPDDYGSHAHYIPSDGGFGIGLLRAHGTDTAGFGRRHGPKPRYRLDGVSVLGGSIGGSVDGRGAMLSLHWSDNH
jgi:hypothetical protein